MRMGGRIVDSKFARLMSVIKLIANPPPPPVRLQENKIKNK